MANHWNKTATYLLIAGFPGYRVGDDGSVWTCKKQGGPILGYYLSSEWREKRTDHGDYPSTILYREGKPYKKYVHQLVLEAFVGSCPPGLECRHLDGNPRNNSLSNLEWGTKKENGEDKVKHGTSKRPGVGGPKGERQGRAKFSNQEAAAIRARHESGEEVKQIRKDYPNLSYEVVMKAAKGITYNFDTTNVTPQET